MAENGERSTGGNPQLSPEGTVATLSLLGITRKQSSRWQRMARRGWGDW